MALHAHLLESHGRRANETDVAASLSASRELYSFLGKDALTELDEYGSQYVKRGRPIRGPVVIQFDLVIQILSQVLEYARQHPLDSAVGFAVLEEYLEKKLGPLVGAIWRKISNRNTNEPPNREIIKLLQIEIIRETPKEKRSPLKKKRTRRGKTTPKSKTHPVRYSDY